MIEEATWAVETQPARDDVQFLDEQINAYNIARTGVNDGLRLTIFVRNAQQTIIAGIAGWTWGGCCEIRSLWVREDFRSRGYGSQLLRTAEREATARGCQQLTLDTHSFQALDFYLKRGYEVFGTLADYPGGHQKYYLRKRLS